MSTVQAPATDNHMNPTSQGSFQRPSGQALYLRYRIACMAIRFWRGVREFADARYARQLEHGRMLNRRLTVRASLQDILSR